MLTTLQAFGEVLLPIMTVVLIGFVLGRAFALDIRTLNRVSMYGLSPCLIFVTLLRTEVAADDVFRIAALTTIVVVGISGCAFVSAYWFGLSRLQRSAFMLSTSFMNSGNYGLPASRFAFGDAGFQLALIAYLTQAILSHTLAVYIASAGNRSRAAAVGQVFRLPIIYAVLLALAFRALGIRMDESNGALAFGLYRGIRLLADAMLPMMILILGMQLARPQVFESWSVLSAAATLRLIVSIPLAYAAALMLGMSGLPLQVGLLQAAMPTAVNMTMLALEFETWPQFVSNVVVITTLGSFVTLTVLLVVLR